MANDEYDNAQADKEILRQFEADNLLNDGAEFSHAEWRAALYTREQWLNEHAGMILDMYAQVMPSNWQPPAVRVSCGWPGIAPGGRVDCVKGVCYDTTGSADNTHEIFVSPMLSDRLDVLDTLAHEITHAIAGVSHQHDRLFATYGAKIGLLAPDGDRARLCAGDKLRAEFERYLSTAPEYPHASLNPPPPQPGEPTPTPTPQPTRLLKADCEKCGYTIRVTMKWASRGLPICPFDHIPFTLANSKPAGDK